MIETAYNPKIKLVKKEVNITEPEILKESLIKKDGRNEEDVIIDFISEYDYKESKCIMWEGGRLYVVLELQDNESIIRITKNDLNDEFYSISMSKVNNNPLLEEEEIPVFILENYRPSDEAGKKWKSEILKKERNKEKIKRFESGSILECMLNDGSIVYVMIRKNEKGKKRYYLMDKKYDKREREYFEDKCLFLGFNSLLLFDNVSIYRPKTKSL